MTLHSPSGPSTGELPDILPIFPLEGVLLLPRGRLPLNIFEPRYLAMFDDALKGNRLIGIIQPSSAGGDAQSPRPVFSVGCAGRIVSFDETDDGRYIVTLAGVCRFTIHEELPVERGYRRVVPDWTAFGGDRDEEQCPGLDRARFVSLLQTYFQGQGLSANWDAIKGTPDERLLTSLAMICPFEPPEKQALLEAATEAERAATLLTLLQMGAHTSDLGQSGRRAT